MSRLPWTKEQIAVGSVNPVKVKAVREVFANPAVIGMRVDSGVSAQPASDAETKKGALHRAGACLVAGTAIGIGLEGGVMETDGRMFCVNWGALVDAAGREAVASGARYPLPDHIAAGIRDGEALGALIDAWTGRVAVHKQEGTVGVFTNGLLRRSELYVHLVRLLTGQYEYLLHNA